MKRFQGFAVGACIILGVGSAAAQSGHGRTITLQPLPIVGRIYKPLVAVEVARVEPKITLTEISQPFFLRIEHATSHDPY